MKHECLCETRPRKSPSTEIPPHVKELIADVLLACFADNEDRPTYDEALLARKSKRASRAETYYSIMSAAQYAASDPTAHEVVTDSGLTHQEESAWQMHAKGFRPSEIARALNVTRPTAVRVLRSAARKTARRGDAFRELHEVYRRETHRHTYRKPTHCPDEPCRLLGYCRYPMGWERY